MSITATLSDGTRSVTLRGLSVSSLDIRPKWVTAHSESLQRWSYQGGDQDVTRWTLTVNFISSTDWATLNTFYRNYAGAGQSLAYTHTDGNLYTAKLVQEGLQGDRIDSQTYSARLVIEIVGSHVA